MARLSLPTDELVTYSSRALLTDLGRYIRPYRVQFAVASVLEFVSESTGLFPAFALAQIITILTRGLGPAQIAQVWQLVALYAAAYVLIILTGQLSKWLGYQTIQRAALDAELATINHLFSVDLSWHEGENSGNKLKRIERGGDGFDQTLRLWLDSYIEIGVNLIGMLFIIARIDTFIGILMVGFLAVFYTLHRRLTKPASQAARVVNINEEAFIGVTFETIANIRTVKVLGMAQGLKDRLAQLAATLLASVRQRTYYFQTRNTVLTSWLQFAKVGFLVVIVMNIIHGHYAIGFLVLFNSYFNDLKQAVQSLSGNAQQIAINSDAIARMMMLQQQPVDIDDDTGKVSMPTEWKTITADHLSFSYSKHRVLSDVSFTIRRGEKIGIVGLSGAGKSTLFKLLLKEHEGFGGHILIDDVPLTRIARSSFVQHTAVVLQETEVFNFPLRDNVTLANPDHANSAAKLRQALTIAHVADFLDRLPAGMDTVIGEKGFKLSGGEKQRLGIARAVFKQPELLFLDEATSHLDSESEQKIQDSLHKFFRNVTAVVIAHRLSTIKEMDRILVLEKGKIIEEGSFQDLYKKHGRFRELWEKQRL